MTVQPRNWRKPIGEILIGKNLINENQLQEALRLQKQRPGEKLGQVLVKLGYVSKKDVLRAYAEQLGMLYSTGGDTD
jgi:type IV pilus assembly protein PilB